MCVCVRRCGAMSNTVVVCAWGAATIRVRLFAQVLQRGGNENKTTTTLWVRGLWSIDTETLRGAEVWSCGGKEAKRDRGRRDEWVIWCILCCVCLQSQSARRTHDDECARRDKAADLQRDDGGVDDDDDDDGGGTISDDDWPPLHTGARSHALLRQFYCEWSLVAYGRFRLNAKTARLVLFYLSLSRCFVILFDYNLVILT